MSKFKAAVWKPEIEPFETGTYSRVLPLIHMAKTISNWEEEHLPIPPTNAGKDLFFRIVLGYINSENRALKTLYWDSEHASSGIRKTLRTLEATGWLSRKPLPEDLRCRTLVATEKFESLIASYVRMLSEKVLDTHNALSSPLPKTNISSEPWKLLIVDDEPDVHDVTRLVLADLEFEGRRLDFLHAYNAAEAIEIFRNHPDISVAFIDVVMESEDSGLRLVRKIREDIGNGFVRLILRTGHPGLAPEREIIAEYDINDYKTKTELSSQRLNTIVISALRSYRDIITIEQRSQAMTKLLDASEAIQRTSSIEELLKTTLRVTLNVLNTCSQEASPAEQSGMILESGETHGRILAASGCFANCENRILLETHPELSNYLTGNLPIKAIGRYIVTRIDSKYTSSRYQMLLDTGRPLTRTDLELLQILHDKIKNKLDIILLGLHTHSMQERARNMLVKLACHDLVAPEQVESIERHASKLTEIILSHQLKLSTSKTIVEVDFVDAAVKYSSPPLKEESPFFTPPSPSELAMRIVSAARLFDEVSRLSSADAPWILDQALVKINELLKHNSDPDMMLSLFLHNQQHTEKQL